MEVIADKRLILTACELLQFRSQFSCPLEIEFPSALRSVVSCVSLLMDSCNFPVLSLVIGYSDWVAN